MGPVAARENSSFERWCKSGKDMVTIETSILNMELIHRICIPELTEAIESVVMRNCVVGKQSRNFLS